MTHLESMELSVCFGLSVGFFAAILFWDIRFAIRSIKEKIKTRGDGDAGVE